MDHELCKDNNNQPYIRVTQSDHALLVNPLLNKGMAFPAEERELFNLWGLLPPSQVDLKTQRLRSWEACQSKPSDVEKYIYLRDLQDSNETLFYSLLCEHIEALMPIVYTPVVGLGCQRYSHIYRRPRGVFIAYPNQNHIDRILSNPRFSDVKVIVVSDGERILGLGDQGAGGMGIPIGKLSLYTACAGIYPAYTLPILLDTGTNNPELQKDALYIGWQHERIRGQEYDDFIERFVTTVEKRFPHILLQWEDFARENAGPLLDRYRNRLCTFNDDIQGTAAIAAATLLSACRISKIPLKQQKIAILGAGSAGCGIARLLKQMMMAEGLSSAEAEKQFYLIDRDGLLLQNQNLLSFQQEFARVSHEIADWKLNNQNKILLEDVIHNAKPTTLVGVSGQGGAFTEIIVREMSKHVKRPAIFPLSNPDSRSEAHPHDVMRWTEGRAVLGTGSPFPSIQGKRIDQTNNCYIFPGLGLALIALQAKYVPDSLFIAAARALADYTAKRHDLKDNLLPPLKDIRDISLAIAVAVAKEIIASGLNQIQPPEDLEKYLRDFMWQPVYVPYQKG